MRKNAPLHSVLLASGKTFELALSLRQRLPSCPYCGSTDNPEGENYCRVCGASLEKK